MTLRQRRSYIAVVIGLLAIVAAAALAASGLAGSISVTFSGVSLTEVVSLGNQGAVKGEVTAPKGITHGELTITLPGDFRSPVCTPSCTPLGGNAFKFDFSLAAGKVYAAFVTYQAVDGVTSLGDHTVNFSLAWDNGNGGQGASNGPELRTAHVNIVAANGTSDAAGECSNVSGNGTDSVLTLQDLGNSNKQSTQVDFGVAAVSPLGYTLPCTGVFAKELGPVAPGRSELSVFNGPTFQGLATLVVRFWGYTAPLTLRLYPNPANTSIFQPVQACPSATTMASGQKVCLVGWQRTGNVMKATLNYAGGDPGLDGV